MTDIQEGSLIFSFDDAYDVIKYDLWPFYLKHFQRIQDTKAVDFLYITNNAAWLIEVKDYIGHNRIQDGTIEDVVVQKVRDTLAGLAAASANGDADEQNIACKALSKHRWRVVLHIEQTNNLICNPSNTQIRLQQRLRAVDSKVLVTNANYAIPKIPWNVSTQTQPRRHDRQQSRWR